MWSVDDVVSWRTCYPAERVRELLTDPVTPEQVASLDIPAVDRACLLLREEPLGQRRQLQLAYAYATGALDAGAAPAQVHALFSDDGPRPDDVSAITWTLLRLSAAAQRSGVSFEAQLPFILEAYSNGR